MSSKLVRHFVRVPEPVVVSLALRPGDRSGASGLTPDPRTPEGQAILAQSQADAQALLDRATAESELLRQRAITQGLAEGRQQGEAEVRLEAQPYLELLAQLAGAAQADDGHALAQLEAALPVLALAIARKVIGAELAVNPNVIVSVVRDCLTMLRDETVIRVRVSPADLEVLSEAWPELWTAGLGAPPVVVADPELPQGGCVLDTDHGALDARLATRLGEIGRALGLDTEDEPPEHSHA